MSIRPTTRWMLTAVLAVVALGSLSLGVTSDGARGLLLGLLLPAFCVAGVSAMHGLLPAFVVAALAWFGGTELAGSIGSNLDDDGEVINIWPLFVAAGLLLAGCVGLFCRLAVDSIRDQ
jgi:hypothetical protein